MLFHVVKFSEGEVGIISDNWLHEDRKSARWPSKPIPEKLMITGHVNTAWPIFPCEVMYSSEDIMKVRKKCRLAECGEDELATADSEEEKLKSRERRSRRFEDIGSSPPPRQTKRRINIAYSSDSDEEQDSVQFSMPKIRTPCKKNKLKTMTPVRSAAVVSPRWNCMRSPNFSNSDRALSTNLLNGQEEIKKQGNETQERLRKIEGMLASLLKVDCPDDEGILEMLPLDKTTFSLLEDRLSDLNLMKKMVRRLSLQGGTDCEGIVKRALTFVLKSDMGLYVTWSGQTAHKGETSKLPLKNSKLVDAIMITLQKASVRGTAKDVKKACQLWLKNSYDRANAQKRRNNITDEVTLQLDC